MPYPKLRIALSIRGARAPSEVKDRPLNTRSGSTIRSQGSPSKHEKREYYPKSRIAHPTPGEGATSEVKERSPNARTRGKPPTASTAATKTKVRTGPNLGQRPAVPRILSSAASMINGRLVYWMQQSVLLMCKVNLPAIDYLLNFSRCRFQRSTLWVTFPLAADFPFHV
ncbi:hypothetical protein J6590_065830 [Homalodisca vitripennis]|nr:hypothetical protein J6590_065830 [Homalodisca vitripennis]